MLSRWFERWFVRWFRRWFGRWVSRWFDRWFGSWFERWFVRWFSRWFGRRFGRWFVRWFSRWFGRWFSRWFDRSWFCSVSDVNRDWVWKRAEDCTYMNRCADEKTSSIRVFVFDHVIAVTLYRSHVVRGMTANHLVPNQSGLSFEKKIFCYILD